jgi:NADPH2:quinone reductase
VRVIRVDRFGEPDVLLAAKVADPEPAAGQVLVNVRMAGVGYGDVIVRSGRYPLPLPWIPGVEVGGQVAAVGPGVDESLLGRTVVATTAGQAGGYAERAVAPAAYTFGVPAGLALDAALAVFQAGALARGLLTAMRLSASDTVLITAAAGRIGSLLVQTAKAAGATVIGAASRPKLAAVRESGADHAVDYGAPGWPDQVRELTGRRGATLVLDAVGGETAVSALAATADGGGRIGLYGYASGGWPQLDAPAIIRRGLSLSGPLGMVIRKPDAEQRDDAEQALTAAARGELNPRIHARFALERAADAHRELEARRSAGAIVLTVLSGCRRPGYQVAGDRRDRDRAGLRTGSAALTGSSTSLTVMSGPPVSTTCTWSDRRDRNARKLRQP